MARQLRLLVTGGRDYADAKYVSKVLHKYLQKAGVGNLCVINGGAPGLDTLATDWCNNNGVPCIVMPAAWEYYKKSAGAIRNSWMLKWCAPTHCRSFPGGRGTADMRAKALKATPRLIVRPKDKNE